MSTLSTPIQIISPRQFQHSRWSGGETTELMIFPPGSSYKDRDFLWRISIATTELEETTFTLLPDYQRLLSVLEGDLSLEFQGGSWANLHVGDILAFDGATPTTSRGSCRDFNVMMRKSSCSGSMDYVTLSRNQQLFLPLASDRDLTAIYCSEGDISVFSGEKSFSLPQNHLGILSQSVSIQSTDQDGIHAFVIHIKK